MWFTSSLSSIAERGAYTAAAVGWIPNLWYCCRVRIRLRVIGNIYLIFGTAVVFAFVFVLWDSI